MTGTLAQIRNDAPGPSSLVEEDNAAAASEHGQRICQDRLRFRDREKAPVATSVRIIDSVVIEEDRLDRWLTNWRTDYLPAAVERGLREPEVWREHVGADTVAVHIMWDLHDPRDLYGIRAAAATDPQVSRFWADTDEVAVSRERHVLSMDRARS